MMTAPVRPAAMLAIAVIRADGSIEPIPDDQIVIVSSPPAPDAHEEEEP